MKIDKGTILNTAVEIIDRVPELNLRREPKTKSDLVNSVTLSPKKKLQLLALLNEFNVCVAMNLSEFGCTYLLNLGIQFKSGAEPPFSKPYLTNFDKREKIKTKVGE